MPSAGSRCQAPGKLQLQKTSGNHRPWAERGTNLGSSEEQQNIARRPIYPKPGHCPGGTSGAPWKSPAPASFCRGLGARTGTHLRMAGWRLRARASEAGATPVGSSFLTPGCVSLGLWPRLSEPRLAHQ